MVKVDMGDLFSRRTDLDNITAPLVLVFWSPIPALILLVCFLLLLHLSYGRLLLVNLVLVTFSTSCHTACVHVISCHMSQGRNHIQIPSQTTTFLVKLNRAIFSLVV